MKILANTTLRWGVEKQTFLNHYNSNIISKHNLVYNLIISNTFEKCTLLSKYFTLRLRNHNLFCHCCIFINTVCLMQNSKNSFGCKIMFCFDFVPRHLYHAANALFIAKKYTFLKF